MIQSKKVKHDRDEMLIVNDKYSLNRFYILNKNGRDATIKLKMFFVQFEVAVELPPFALSSDDSLMGTVRVKYVVVICAGSFLFVSLVGCLFWP